MCPVVCTESDTFLADCPALSYVFVEIQIQICLVGPSTNSFLTLFSVENTIMWRLTLGPPDRVWLCAKIPLRLRRSPPSSIVRVLFWQILVISKQWKC